MIGTTLGEIRSAVEALSSEDGSYYLVCARTGDRPVPAADLRFDSRACARAAATATEQYRAALRRYDPQLPYYDVVACQAGETESDGRSGGVWTATAGRDRRAGGDAGDSGRFTPAASASSGERSALVECCHRVVAAAFEALSAAGHDAVESAVMDAYVELAEAVEDPDELCCCLLECMAAEIDRELSPRQQAAVVADAADRLPAPQPTDRPLSATLEDLQARGLLAGHARSRWSADPDGARSVVALVDGYVLSPRDGRLPVLPVVVELLRRQPDWQPATLDVVALDVGWKLRLTLADETPPRGLASAPIRRRA
ncbi:hypothetical protein GCM10028857_24010 [Salinarchaeum chitinilyticum]